MSAPRFIISRTDNLGDVVLTLPLAGYLKSIHPSCTIYFIGKAYTEAIIKNCRHIDHFLNREAIIKDPGLLKETEADCVIHVFPDKEVAKACKKAGIKKRIGTSHRLFHWLYCNSLPSFSRKGSDLHESQLNFKLLEPLGIKHIPAPGEVKELYGLSAVKRSFSLPENGKLRLIIHPKSKGSAREWPMSKYLQLVQSLPKDDFEFYITGTKDEGALVMSECDEIFRQENVHNMTGRFSLDELISFIDNCDGLLACSTGPLHIASALGKKVLGLFVPIKPLHPGRWMPIGEKAEVISLADCSGCPGAADCSCIRGIEVNSVAQRIKAWKE